MPHWLKLLLLGLLLLLIGSIPLAMQFESGSIHGTITDDVGPLPNASIEARHLINGVTSRAESGLTGKYTLDHLRIGRYSLWVHAPGHDATWIPEVIVQQGVGTRVDIHLARTHTIPTTRNDAPPSITANVTH